MWLCVCHSTTLCTRLEVSADTAVFPIAPCVSKHRDVVACLYFYVANSTVCVSRITECTARRIFLSSYFSSTVRTAVSAHLTIHRTVIRVLSLIYLGGAYTTDLIVFTFVVLPITEIVRQNGNDCTLFNHLSARVTVLIACVAFFCTRCSRCILQSNSGMCTFILTNITFAVRVCMRSLRACCTAHRTSFRVSACILYPFIELVTC